MNTNQFYNLYHIRLQSHLLVDSGGMLPTQPREARPPSNKKKRMVAPAALKVVRPEPP